jgi:large subunit ribosomal protein L10
MDNPRPEKVATVAEVRDRLSSSSAALLTEYRGLKVKDLAELRTTIRDAGGEYKIYKNTLVRLAVQELELDGLDGLLTGPTAIAFVEGDAVLVAKSLRDFAKTNPALAIKGGILGKAVLTASDATALADVAPREVLLAQFAGALAAPLQKMAGLLAALPRNFAYGLKALLDQKGGPPAEAPAEAPAAEAPAEVPAEASAEAPAEAPAEAAAEASAEAPAEAPAEAAAEAPAAPVAATEDVPDTEDSEKE